jgi:hypothetical protein
MFSIQEYNDLINIPKAIIIASLIIIIVTTNLMDKNALIALISGYSGLLLGILVILILNWPLSNWVDIVPFIVIIFIIGLLIYYISTYLEQLTKGNVSNYYNSFSILSTIFLAIQISTIFSSINKNINNNTNLFTPSTLALLGLIGLINIIIVFTIGLILNCYSTQG